LKIAVITSGGDAQGMNSFIEAFVKNCNHEVVYYKSGIKGIYERDIFPISKKDVDGISSLGGSVIKTSRFKEDFLKADVQKRCIENLKEDKIDCLIILGGDGSKKASQIFSKHIKTLFVPASIDNDIDGLESIGFDSALNRIVECIDNVKTTARSHNRDFVIEVMGNGSEFIAKSCDLAGLPDITILSEKDIEGALKKVALKESNIIVVPEGATDIDILCDKLSKNHNREVRKLILGHMQRGGAPSARDRILASKYAKECIEKIEIMLK